MRMSIMSAVGSIVLVVAASADPGERATRSLGRPFRMTLEVRDAEDARARPVGVVARIPRARSPGAMVAHRDDQAFALARTALMEGLITLRADVIARVLALDFRYFTSDAEFRARFPEGWGREDELIFIQNLARGGHGFDGPRLARFAIANEGGEELPDAFTDRDHRRVFRFRRLHFEIEYSNGESIVTEPADHLLVFERGDVARVPPGMPRDDRHWYLLVWVEGLPLSSVELLAAASPDTAAVADTVATADSAVAAARSSEPIALSLRRISGLRDWPVLLDLSLAEASPARLALFDVAGRSLLRRELVGLEPGAHRVVLDAPRVAPGVYWLRLTQAGRQVTIRMIALR